MDVLKLGGTEMINRTKTILAIRRTVCVPVQRIDSEGILLKDNPLDFPYPLMLFQIILLVLISRALYCLLRPLGQTKFVCNLLGGIILGPSLLGHNKALRDKLMFGGKDVGLSDTIARVGVIYSVFLISVKYDMATFKMKAKNGWKISLVGFLFPSAVTSSLVYTNASTISGLSGGTFFLLALTFSLSFTYFPVVAEALDELNLMTSELGQLAMSSATINDIIQWIFTVVHLIVIKRSINDGAKTLVSLLALILFTVFVIQPVIKWIVKRIPDGQEVKDGYVSAMQLMPLVMAFLSDIIGMRPEAGPILLGLVVPNGPPLGAALVQKTEFVVSEIFLPLFFFRVGLTVNVYSVDDWSSFRKLQLMLTMSYVAKIIAVTVIALCCKIRLRNAFLLSMMMSMKGLIELIVYDAWKAVKDIDEQFFTHIVLSALVMTMIASPLVRFLYTPPRASETILSRVRNIQSMPSNSDMFRILCCFHNEESIPNIISLLEASNPTPSSPIYAYVVHAVELVGRAVPRLVPFNTEKQKKKYTRKNSATRQMVRAFDNYLKISSGPVIIQAYTMIAPYKFMHESLFRLADDKFVPLIIVPFHENHPGVVGPSMVAAIRHFNANVQLYSQCTVGILVDRGMSCSLSSVHFSCNVALFFIGGADDREALAFTARMSGNPNVGMTVFRIALRSKLKERNEEEQVAAKLDESLVDEFRLRNIGNDRLDWLEIEVDDSVQLMDAVMNSQGSYDLVIVGRRHADTTLRDKEMSEFVENAELGVIGDIVASSDFCGGQVNVLVIQESRELGYGAFRSGL
ncbi:PREDICTED: cation/H(+) antiporter 15-like [Prunus mume]|uniref:Cation/H(+) antiporter 15-like n=1 Tax=Prunus mume TaxID=102107 RepID=A0ABM0P414_PRUMU|nr:PREDICTED: cation/H(+) antiporter 15-like [Prunus mume]